MDNKKYSVDDILNEVRMKKLSKDTERKDPVNSQPITLAASGKKQTRDNPALNQIHQELRQTEIPTMPSPNNMSETQRIRFNSEEFKSIFQTDELPVKKGKDRNVFEPEHKGKEQEKRSFVVSIKSELDDEPAETIFEKHTDTSLNKQKNKVAFLGSEEDKDTKDDENTEDSEKEEYIDDFNSYADAPSILRDLKITCNSIIIRFIITGITGLLLLYMNVATSYGYPFPQSLHPSNEPLLYMVISLVLTLIGTISCIKMVAKGIAAAVTFKPSNDSLCSLAVLACLAQNSAAIFFIKDAGGRNMTLFSSVAILGLAFNLFGKKKIIDRILRNFRFVASAHDKFAIEVTDSKTINTNLISQTEGNVVACSSKTAGFLTNFLEHSYSDDASDMLCKVLAPLSLLGGITVGLGCYFTYNDLYTAFVGFAATVCICSPFSSVLCCNGPLLRLTKKLQKCGGMVAGSSSVEEFCKTNVLLVKEKELIVPAFAHLHGIKTFGGNRIDESIIYAASMVCRADGTLAEVFLQVIEGRRELLMPIETVNFEQGLGISAYMEDKQVLFGNRSLMQGSGIDVPSKDYEARYNRNGRDLLYLAVSGELCAMFVISYKADAEIKYAVQCLEFCDAKIGIKTTDPNLTSEKMAEIFEVDKDFFIILDTEVYRSFDMLDAPKEKAPAMAGHLGNFESYSKVIVGIKRVKSCMGLAVMLLSISVILGYALAALLAIFSGIGQLNPVSVLGYQLFFTVLITFLPSFKKMYI